MVGDTVYKMEGFTRRVYMSLLIGSPWLLMYEKNTEGE